MQSHQAYFRYIVFSIWRLKSCPDNSREAKTHVQFVVATCWISVFVFIFEHWILGLTTITNDNTLKTYFGGHCWVFLKIVLFVSLLWKDVIETPLQQTLLQHFKNGDCSECFSDMVCQTFMFEMLFRYCPKCSFYEQVPVLFKGSLFICINRFPRSSKKKKSTNDDKNGYGHEKRRPSTLCWGNEGINTINNM